MESPPFEWTTPVRPPHGNWPGEIPEVYRPVYDDGRDNIDFVPQTMPLQEDETPEP
ncbi:MAG TPA: hypothetical protein VM802_12855 [Chitinophaga sp.]|uniref:hypothetical protein n=1 Tax=Chitinophaga sp. TaxID=1869181 RepID=UPI002C4BA189|nr:hypothetical protein [Chitinophaga sp.]HVI45757.1 hypothetical protein [Chitinophaga sp.]